MSKIDVIKENIQFEQLLRECDTTNALNEEYLIPDTHPDVEKVLMIEARPNISSKEILADKVIIEGTVDYNLLYLAKEENTIVSSVNYSQQFNSSLSLEEGEHRVLCEVECSIEHIEGKIINERKVAIDGMLAFNWELYNEKEVELIKDIEGADGVEILKKNEVINNTNANKNIDIAGKSVIRVSMDKPQVSKILKSKLNLHKKEIKVGEDKVYCGCYCTLSILYLSNENKDIYYLEDNIYLSKEVEVNGVTPDMMMTADYSIKNKEVVVEEDDLGEARIINTEVSVECNVKVFSNKNIDIVIDAYSPKFAIDVLKDEYEMGMIKGIYNNETIVKDNIYMNEGDMIPEKIITFSGKPVITEKSLVDDRVIVSGYISCEVVYKTNDEDRYLEKVSGDIPFNVGIEANGVNENMKALVKANIESMEVAIEANTIAIKANLNMCAKVLYEVRKEFVKDVLEGSEEKIEKKASITIYIISEGDTLWNLAKKYSTTVDEIVRINEIEDPNYLVTGEKLLIPGRAIV